MPDAPKGTVLAFDFGEARIGVAQGDVRSGATMQIASAVGEGAVAALQIREYLQEKAREE